MSKSITMIFLVLSFFCRVSAQQSAIYTNKLVKYNKALVLYNNQQYLAAQNVFDNARNTTNDEYIIAQASYYIASCAMWLKQKNADDLMKDFINRYPTNTKRNEAYIDIANYYFENAKYEYAIKWYDKVDQYTMSSSQKQKFNFNKGYAYFYTKKLDKAQKLLDEVKDSKEYGAQAKYYLGFIAYEGDDYQKADKLFDAVKDRKGFTKNVSYFQSDMSFKSGYFKKAIQEGIVQLPKSKPSEKSELNKIIGESYFNLKKYKESISYLKAYKGRKGKWNNTDYYQLGYAYYKQGAYIEAISEFNKIVDGRDAIAQNAYYHLAESYLKSGQKQQALHAFKNASEMNFQPKIKEDATYNYAKLSYEIGNSYQSTPKVLISYLEKYPSSVFREEIQELLISSYLTSKNYKEAMRLLEASRNFDNKTIFQKVAFFRGIELYNDGDYKQAQQYFDKSLRSQTDSKYVAKAIYWKSESDYLLNNFEEALIGFKQFKGATDAVTTNEYRHIDYAIGYAYFKLKRYSKAAKFFDNYSKQKGIDDSRLTDTYLRLGDSYFISSKYWPAMEAYNQAKKRGGVDADYAHYQKAISYGFVKKNNKKIKDLELFLKLYSTSAYQDDAMYALGNTYIEENDTRKGIEVYETLIKQLPSSSYVPKALLKQGLVFYNQDQGDRALYKFKKVVADFPATEESIQAVHTARLIYVDLGRTTAYANWVKKLDFISVTDADLDNTTYEAVEKQYAQGNISASISGFRKYLKEFPKGIHALKSHFYLAQLLYDKGDWQQTVSHYQYILQKDRTEYTEQALARLSQIYLENKDDQKAIPILERLDGMADFPQNIIFAQSNLMKSHYQLSHYQETILYGEKVLQNSKIQDDIKSDAQLFIARASLETKNYQRAELAYAEVGKLATGELAAEAQYYQAYFENKKKKYKVSNESIQKLAKEYSGYKLYGAKGLLLMVKNFYGLEDAYQATYILESVIKNFSEYPIVVQEATSTLKRIRAEEAKTNSSIQIEQ